LNHFFAFFLFFFSSCCTVHSNLRYREQDAQLLHQTSLGMFTVFHHLAWRQVMLSCSPSHIFEYVSRESSRTKIYGPNSQGTAKVFSPSFPSFCFARIPQKAQQQDGARALYSKAGQISAGLRIAGKSGAHARESMNHTRVEMNKFRRCFGANQ
jgi:hypothetical protein